MRPAEEAEFRYELGRPSTTARKSQEGDLVAVKHPVGGSLGVGIREQAQGTEAREAGHDVVRARSWSIP